MLLSARAIIDMPTAAVTLLLPSENCAHHKR
jgi:hypothetical protein